MDKEQAFFIFQKSIRSLVDVPDELPKNLFNICRLRTIEKNQFFIHQGEFPEYVGFNLNGVFRLYYIDNDGNDWTKGFSTQGKFVISYSAMVQNRASYFNIEAINDADILEFRYREWMNMIESDHRWYPFIYRLLQTVYVLKEMREKSLLLDDATQRYRDFRNDYPEVDSIAKLYQIASFIGITPESLSRIRKNLKLT